MNKTINTVLAVLNTIILGFLGFMIIVASVISGSRPEADSPLFIFLLLISIGASIVSGWNLVSAVNEKKKYQLLLLFLTLLPWLIFATLLLVDYFLHYV